MSRKPAKPGFTMAEILSAIFIIGVMAIVVVPKLMVPNNDRQSQVLIKESFTVIGEAYLARKNDTSMPAEAIGAPGENENFYRYLYDHLNYQTAIDPATTIPNTVCLSPDDYFVLPLDVKIRSICDMPVGGAGVPDYLAITVRVPSSNAAGFIEYIMAIPEAAGDTGVSEERYTTLFGQTAVAGDCNDSVDPLLNIVNTCP